MAESKKARRQTNAFNQRSLMAAQSQFKKQMKFQAGQAAEMARLSNVAPTGSDSTRDMASAADEIARQAAGRSGFRRYRFAA